MRDVEKEEWFEGFREKYLRSSKCRKRELLDSLVETVGVHRKSAIRLLKRRNPGRKPGASNRGRRSKYSGAEFVQALRRLWRETNYMNSRNLHSAIPQWLPSLEFHYGGLNPEVKELLLAISARSIDRVLKPHKAAWRRKAGTKPGSLIKNEIPIQGSIWDIGIPGFLEADTVAHCGSSLEGLFVWSLTLTDICTQWTECRAVWHKAAKGVVEQIKDVEAHLPFEMRGFDCDNGSEFLNNYLVAYFSEKRRVRVDFAFTRSRPYHKNDNAHVEQRNWTHPRQLFGRVRIDEYGVVSLMNDLYKNEFSLLRNHFFPTLKLEEKVMIKSRYRRKYGEPKTPYQRVIDSPDIPENTKMLLTELHHSLDPISLKRAIDKKLKLINNRLKTSKMSLSLNAAA